jgi:hypothetical protein
LRPPRFVFQAPFINGDDLMLRVTMILLCFLLAAAAAGRYQAEADVRETRQQIRNLDRLKAQEERQIQVLRTDITYLESPDRLARVAQKTTDLRPLSASQLMSAEDFVVAFSGTHQAPVPAQADFAPVRNASASTDVALAE